MRPRAHSNKALSRSVLIDSERLVLGDEPQGQQLCNVERSTFTGQFSKASIAVLRRCQLETS
jgi:hypothetical protein